MCFFNHLFFWGKITLGNGSVISTVWQFQSRRASTKKHDEDRIIESTLRTRGGGQAGQEVRRRRQEDNRGGYLAWVSDMAKNMAKPNKELKAIYCSTQANKDKLLTEFLPSLDDEVGLFCWIVCYL